MIASLVVILALCGFLGYTVVALKRAKREAVLVRNSVTPKPSIQAPARPDRDLATLNARWINEQEHLTFPDAQHNHTNCRVCGPGPLGRNEVPSIYDHVMYEAAYSTGYSDYYVQPKTSDPARANVVSSEIEGTDLHTLMIDIDMPARLIESSTPGCYHLYIDRPMTYKQLKAILEPMMNAGVVEEGFYKMFIKHKATHLRPPWFDKELP